MTTRVGVEHDALLGCTVDVRPDDERVPQGVDPWSVTGSGNCGPRSSERRTVVVRAVVVGRPRDVVAVGRVVHDRRAVALLGDMDEPVGGGLELGELPRRVGVRRPEDVPELRLRRGALGVDRTGTTT